MRRADTTVKVTAHPEHHTLGGALEQPQLDGHDGGAEHHQAAEHQQRSRQRAVIGQGLDHLARRERLSQPPGRAEQPAPADMGFIVGAPVSGR
jgi:hypothetical protein